MRTGTRVRELSREIHTQRKLTIFSPRSIRSLTSGSCVSVSCCAHNQSHPTIACTHEFQQPSIGKQLPTLAPPSALPPSPGIPAGKVLRQPHFRLHCRWQRHSGALAYAARLVAHGDAADVLVERSLVRVELRLG
jgi:hypothetical protein